MLALILIGLLPIGFAQEDLDPVAVCNQTITKQNAPLVLRACSIVAELADTQLYRENVKRVHLEKREGGLSAEQLSRHDVTVDNIRRNRFVANYKRLLIVQDPHQKCWLSRKVLLDAEQFDITESHSELAGAVKNGQTLSDACEAEFHSRALLDETEFTDADGSHIQLRDVVGWSYDECLNPHPRNPYETLTACRELERLLLPWRDIQLDVQKAFPGIESIAERNAALREDLGILYAQRMQILSVISRADIPTICHNAEVALLFFDDSGAPNYDVDWVRDAIRGVQNKHIDCIKANLVQ